MAAEIRADWIGARVERAGQSDFYDVYLQLYAARRTACLILSARPDLGRVHLAPARPGNLPVPPAFCQALRRHVEGGRLLTAAQDGLERSLQLEFQSRDDLGNPRVVRLVAELTGHLANLVLVGPDGRVLDALRRIDEDCNRVRQTLPGLPYAVPPRTPGKVDPVLSLRAGGPAGLAADLEAAWTRRPAGEQVVERLTATVFGVSRPLARALGAWAAGAPGGPAVPEGLPASLPPLGAVVAALAASVANSTFRPCVVRDSHGDPLPQAWPLPGTAAASAATPSEACVQAYADLTEIRRTLALRQRIAAVLRAARERTARRLAKQEEELAAAHGAEALREAGELLLTYPHLVPRGAAHVDLPSFSDPARPVGIELDPRLSASANAQRLLRRYQKERRAAGVVAAHLELGRSELGYIAEAELALAQAEATAELAALEAELAEQGLLGRQRRAARRRAPAGRGSLSAGGKAETRRPEPAPPLVFSAAAGWRILVGRNAAGNDRLTMRLARPDDIWLHAKQMPGSHVLLRPPAGGPAADPPEEALLQAARCAAYYSAGRSGRRIPVDHTRRRHVWKPGGARPGFVLYAEERTLLVDPVDLPPREEPAARAGPAVPARARPGGE